MRSDKSNGSGVKIFGYVLLLFFSVVLLGSVIRIVFGSSSFSFSSFLQYITNVPQIILSDVQIFHIGGNWGIVEGLRVFLNHIMSIANFAVWFSTQLLNGLTYIFYFVRFLFVGV